ncbi:SigE family RNA polymerase sigma factor [Actinocorallia longicatena]|uniref:SigE family RNA polymerase sigma factor n=1 Tax=Actinocorallia longicatena TaxID=111803 RepID=A0ABP6QE03_9ACTN
MKEGEIAFTQFVRTRGLGLLRFATALSGDRHHAEDVLQNVLERAYPRWAKIAAHGDPEWYLRRSIVNAVKDGWRAKQRRPEIVGLPEEGWEASYLPFDAVVTRDAVRRALNNLPQGQRTVVVLRYWEGLTEAETAQIMGVSLGTVKSQGHRAVRALREQLALQEQTMARWEQ